LSQRAVLAIRAEVGAGTPCLRQTTSFSVKLWRWIGGLERRHQATLLRTRPPVARRRGAGKALLQIGADLAEQAGELHWNEERATRTRPERLQTFDHLDRHRLGVHLLRRRKDGLQGLGVALSLQDLALAFALRTQDLRLLFSFGDGDRRLPFTLSFGHRGTPRTLGRHLAVHGLLNLTRWQDLADLHRGYLDTPALCDLVQLAAQVLIDLLATCQDIIQHDVADHGAQRRGRNALRSAGEIGHGDDAGDRVDHLPIHQE